MSWYVARSLDQLLAEINASAPARNKSSDGSIGDTSHSSRDSDHNPCDCHNAVCARDYTHDPAGGFDSYAFAHWLAERTKGPETRVKYIISNGRIASGQGQSYPAGVWRPYTGSNPHDHHVHVSVRHGAELFDDAGGWAWAAPGKPPPTEPEEHPQQGAFDMLLSIQDRGKFAVIGNVSVGLTEPQWDFAVQWSSVPQLHLPRDVADNVEENLVHQTFVATAH